MSWKPEVMVAGNGDKWSRNALCFATEKEAKDNAYALMMRWTLVVDCRAAESTDPVNYAYIDGQLVEVKSPAEQAARRAGWTLHDGWWRRQADLANGNVGGEAFATAEQLCEEHGLVLAAAD